MKRGRNKRESKEIEPINFAPILQLLESSSLKEKAARVSHQISTLLQEIICIMKQKNIEQARLSKQIAIIFSRLFFEGNKSEGLICRQLDLRLKYYRCHNCQCSGVAACFCENCFDPEIHLGHNFTILDHEYHCDCGDKTFIKEQSFCSRHSAKRQNRNRIKFNDKNFKREVRFLLFLLFQIKRIEIEVKIIPNSSEGLSGMIFELVITILLEIVKGSDANKNTIAGVLFKTFNEENNQFSTVMSQLLSYNWSLNNKKATYYLTMELYALPDIRPLVIKEFWNNSNSSNCVYFRQLMNYFLSDVQTIVSLVEEGQLDPFELKKNDLMLRDSAFQNRGFAIFFQSHSVMSKSVHYAYYVEQIVLKRKFHVFFEIFQKGKSYEMSENQIVEKYQIFSFGIIKSICQLDNSKKILSKMIYEAVKFCSRICKENTKQWLSKYAKSILTLSTLAYFDFDLSNIERQELATLIKMFGPFCRVNEILKESFQSLVKIDEPFPQFEKLHNENRLYNIHLCLYLLNYKILLILHKRMEEEFNFKYFSNWVEESLSSKKLEENFMTFHFHVLYVLQSNLPETILSHELGHTNFVEMDKLKNQLLKIHKEKSQKEMDKIFSSWIGNWKGLENRFEFNENMAAKLQCTISFTSILARDTDQIMQKWFQMKLNSKVRQNEFVSYYFPPNFATMLIEIFQKMKKKKISKKAEQNKSFENVVHLSLLLFLETKEKIFEKIVRQMINFVRVQDMTLSESFKKIFRVMENGLNVEKIQTEAMKNENLKPQKVQKLSKVRTEKFQKLKEMQKKTLIKFSEQIIKEQEKEIEQVCILCRQPGNLQIICLVRFDQIFSKTKFGSIQPIMAITSCGHRVHYKCCQKINKKVEVKSEKEAVFVEEYKCSYCRKYGNILFPALEQKYKQRQIQKNIHFTEQTLLFYYRKQKMKANPWKIQIVSSDQLLFEMLVNQIYLFFFTQPSFYFSQAKDIMKCIFTILKWKIRRQVVTISPIYVMLKDPLFYYVQELLVLLLYLNDEHEKRVIFELEEQIQVMNILGHQDECKRQLLKLCTFFINGISKPFNTKLDSSGLNFYPFESNYEQFSKVNQICQVCSKNKRKVFMTDQIKICIICGYKFCLNCLPNGNHTHSEIKCFIEVKSGVAIVSNQWKLCSVSVYTNKFNVKVPSHQNRNEVNLSSYCFNKENYEILIKSLLLGMPIQSEVEKMNGKNEDTLQLRMGTINWSRFIQNISRKRQIFIFSRNPRENHERRERINQR